MADADGRHRGGKLCDRFHRRAEHRRGEDRPPDYRRPRVHGYPGSGDDTTTRTGTDVHGLDQSRRRHDFSGWSHRKCSGGVGRGRVQLDSGDVHAVDHDHLRRERHGERQRAFTAIANSSAARTGAITIAGQTFTVLQADGTPPPPCLYSIGPASQSFTVAGGPATFNVSAGTGCAWSATPSGNWILIVSGTSGSGNGTVALAIAPNLGPARTGTVGVAGQTYTVTQAAALPPPPNCTYAIDPTSDSFAAGGAMKRHVKVQTQKDCLWTASSNVSWLIIRKGATGHG